MLQPGQHYLVAVTGYSGSMPPDQTYTSDVPDAGGFAIVSGTFIIDQVGFGTKSAYKEGTPLTALSTNTNQSYARNGGGCTDTNNNSADFTLINPSAPQDKASPFTPCSPTTTATVLQYAYDPVYRLTSGIYSGTTGVYTFAYGYDGVGNRTAQTRTVTSTQTISYTYDNANRLTNVGGQTYSWDANGNLLNDGGKTYAYDQANRLKTLTQTATVYSFAYNRASDRLKQIIAGTLTTYTLDLNAGLTQVLADGGNRYVYGNSRVAQYAGANASYFLADGLGSVRQLADNTGLVTLADRCDPFDGALTSAGNGTSEFGFAGEQTDATGMEYLRARYYAPGQGRFVTKDPVDGDSNRRLSFNPYQYAYANPVLYVDPSGKFVPMGCWWPYQWRIDPTTGLKKVFNHT